MAFTTTVYLIKDSVTFAVQRIKKFLLIKQSSILLLVKRGSKISINNVKTVLFYLKDAIIMGGEHCNTILWLAIKKCIQLFSDVKSLLCGLVENQKLIQCSTWGKPIFRLLYAVTLGFLTLQKPRIILYYGRPIIEIYCTCWSGFFGPCFCLVCGLIILLVYLLIAVLYIKSQLEQVKDGNIWDKLLCLVTRIGRVTLGILVLYSICKHGGMVIMWKKEWELFYATLVCLFTGWGLPMPSVSMTMLPTNSSFGQPVTSQAVVASVPLAQRPVASQAGVASVPLPELPEQPVAVASDALQPPRPLRPYAVAMPRPPGFYTYYNGVEIPCHPSLPYLLSMAHSHPLILGQTTIGMSPIWQDPLPLQINVSYDRQLPFINPYEIILPVNAKELKSLEEYRLGLIEQQNRFNNPFRPAVLLVRDALAQTSQLSEQVDLVHDARILRSDLSAALNREWFVVQYHNDLTQALDHKERLEMEISRLVPQIQHLR